MACNEQFSIPAHTNTFAKIDSQDYMPMHGMCWVSAVPYLCMCMWWLCRCLCLCVFVVLGIFWENGWVDMGYLCSAVCMCVCIYVSVTCMSASMYVCLNSYESCPPCTNVQILMFWMGVENTCRWDSVPEMDVWGQAPHHMHNRSLH